MLFAVVQVVFHLVKFFLDRRHCVELDEEEDTMFTVISDYEVQWDETDYGPPSSRLSVNENDLRGIKLTPAPYLQRFGVVKTILSPENKVNQHFRKVVEFGCADLKMASVLKSVNNLEEIIFVDKDKQILNQCEWRIQPDEDDQFYSRKRPLKMKVYEGCCTKYDPILENTDAVLCIELIQTLSADELDKLIKNIFENIQPEMIIFTTPNKDFNPLLDLTSNLRRHKTHKFEWTRNQFKNWGNNLARIYPNYIPFFYFCGTANKRHMQQLGGVTQICAFRRLQKVHREIEHLETESGYRLVAKADYFHLTDAQILEKAISLIRNVNGKDCAMWEYSECDENEIPINEVFSELYYRTGYERFLDVIREDGWIFNEMRNVIISCPHHDISTAIQGRRKNYFSWDNVVKECI